MPLAAHSLRAAADRKVAGALWVIMFLAMALRPAVGAGLGKDPYETLLASDLGGDLKQGYVLRADSWSGDLPIEGSKRIEHTLLRGNDYRFFACATIKGAKISFHVQDRDGAIVESRCWQKEKDDFCLAGADITPARTGSFYLVVKVEQSPVERTGWLLVYAYK